MITRWVVGISLLFVVLLLTLPRTDEKSLSGIASASMLMCTKDFRTSLSERIGDEDLSGIRFENKCPGLIAELVVDEDGGITVFGKEHDLKMVLTPKIENGRVRWSCKGEPESGVTALCKE